MVPLFAFGAWALYGRRRRFYAEHLVFAFYIFAFVMLWPFVIYLFAAARRTYAESRWRTAFKTLLLSGWVLAVLTAYRFVLFFTSFYAT